MLAPFRRFADFRGRARRKEFWWFAVLAVLLGSVAGTADPLLGPGRAVDVIAGTIRVGMAASLLSLLLFVPSLAVAVRRLHDTGRSGWWFLIVFVPLIGWLILLMFYFGDGERGPNRFGPDPKVVTPG